ncbi:MAG: TRAP transporter substrate-binding protein [Deltaproteobacteria bacterium]|nr:TRAP transporter substrate-binding protein [Deltaproteobacteria bacterium]
MIKKVSNLLMVLSLPVQTVFCLLVFLAFEKPVKEIVNMKGGIKKFIGSGGKNYKKNKGGREDMTSGKVLFKRILVVLFVFAFCFSVIGTAHAKKPISFKFGFVSSPKMQGGIYGQLIEKYVNEACEGKVKAKFFPSALLGTDPEMMDKTRLGLIQGLIAPLNVYGNAVPYVDVLMLPFVSNSWEKVNNFIESPVAEEFLKGVEKYGYKGLGYSGYGLSGLECNTKATTLAELQKLKFRVPESPVLRRTFEALKITPMVIQFPDLYESLKQGVVDGCDLPADVAVFVKFTEVIRYFIQTNHNFGWYMFAVNKKWYDNLPGDVKGPFTEAVKRASRESIKRSYEAEKAALKVFSEKGIKITKVPDRELKKMVELTKPVFDWRLQSYNDQERKLAIKVLKQMGYEYN